MMVGHRLLVAVALVLCTASASTAPPVAAQFNRADIAFRACKRILEHGKEADCETISAEYIGHRLTKKLAPWEIRKTCDLMLVALDKVLPSEKKDKTTASDELEPWCKEQFTFGSGDATFSLFPKPDAPKPKFCDETGCGEDSSMTCTCTGTDPLTNKTKSVPVPLPQMGRPVKMEGKKCSCGAAFVTDKSPAGTKIKTGSTGNADADWDLSKSVGKPCLTSAGCPQGGYCRCQLEAPKPAFPCSKHGVKMNGMSPAHDRERMGGDCHCDPGYSGEDCGQTCNDRGALIGGRCVCREGYMGKLCERQLCSLHGSVVKTSKGLGGIQLDGSSYVHVPSVARRSTYTIEAWITSTPGAAQSANAGIVMAGGDTPGTHWGIAIQDGTIVSFNTDGTVQDNWDMGPFDDTLKGRHHIAVTDDGKKRRFFVDGDMKAMYANRAPNSADAVPLRIGAIGGNCTELRGWTPAARALPAAATAVQPDASSPAAIAAIDSAAGNDTNRFLQVDSASAVATSSSFLQVAVSDTVQDTVSQVLTPTYSGPLTNPPAPELAIAGCGFKGSIAGVRVWTRALNFAELQGLMRSTATNVADELAGEWRLDEFGKANSPQAQDRSLNQVKGTFIGTAAPVWVSTVNPDAPTPTPVLEAGSSSSSSGSGGNTTTGGAKDTDSAPAAVATAADTEVDADSAVAFVEIMSGAAAAAAGGEWLAIRKYKCTCSKGYSGWDCSVHVCNNHGMVSTPDEGSTQMGCMCFPGYSGATCSASENKACLNGGQMAGGVCSCPSDHQGDRCQHHICNGFGDVVGPKRDKCKCAAGRAGRDCSICAFAVVPLAPGKTLVDRNNVVYPAGGKADLSGCSKYFCNFHGTPAGGKCVCDANWEGMDCFKHRCSEKGRVVAGRCSCETDWSGDRCELHVCNKHGVLRAGVCRCEPGWKGAHCRTAVCSGHGKKVNATLEDKVTVVSQCECKEPWSGPNCSQHLCNSKGVWLPGDKRCLCEDEFLGAKCETHVCSHHGSFLNERCACDFGWCSQDCGAADMSPARLALEASNPVSKKACSCQMVVTHPKFKSGFGFPEDAVFTFQKKPWDANIKGIGWVSTPLAIKTADGGDMDAGEEGEEEALKLAAMPPDVIMGFVGEVSQTVISADVAGALGIDPARVTVVKAEMTGGNMKAFISIADERGEKPVSELKKDLAELNAAGGLTIAGQQVVVETPPPPKNLAGIFALHNELSGRTAKLARGKIPGLHERLDPVAAAQAASLAAGSAEGDQILALQGQMASLEKLLGLKAHQMKTAGLADDPGTAAANAFGADGKPKPGFSADGKPKPGFGSDGRPLSGFGPDGKPLPGFGVDGKPMPGFGPDGKPLPGFGPDGKPLSGFGPDGKPILGPDGKPLNKAFGADGKPLSGFGPDGKLLPGFGPDGKPLLGPDGKPLNSAFGPDGKPMPGFGPDGKPLPGYGPDGKPLPGFGPDGKPLNKALTDAPHYSGVLSLNVEFAFVQSHASDFAARVVSDVVKTLGLVSNDMMLVTGVEAGSTAVKFSLLDGAGGKDIPLAVLAKTLQSKSDAKELKFAEVSSLVKKAVEVTLTSGEILGPDGKPPAGFGPDGKPLEGFGADGKPLGNARASPPKPTAGATGIVTRMREVTAAGVCVGDGRLRFTQNRLTSATSKAVTKVTVTLDVSFQWASMNRVLFLSSVAADVGAAIKISKEQVAVSSVFSPDGLGVKASFSLTGFGRQVNLKTDGWERLSKAAGKQVSGSVKRTDTKEVPVPQKDIYMEAGIVQFNGFTQLGVGAMGIQMKTLSLPMPDSGKDANILPHGFKSLDQIQWIDVVAQTTKGGNVKLFDVASTHAACNCTTDREVLYHWWMDHKNINVLQTNTLPGSLLDQSSVKVTILFSKPK